MGPTLVIARGRSFFVVEGGSVRSELPRPLGGPPGEGGPVATKQDGRVPPGLVDALRGLAPATPLLACGADLAEALGRALGRPVGTADPAGWHAALGALPAPEPGAERAFVLARARAVLEAALRSPEEVLVSLAREEERLERSVGREDRAAEAFVAVPGTPLADVARDWSGARTRLREHHRGVVSRLETEVRRLAPNLSAVVGPRTAARLVAAAGGLAPLARIPASRLQLLGSRRRPSAERGPRHGTIFLADGADEVPPGRRAAYLRSVAALAVIAARADALTHAAIAAGLVRRREARRAQLARSRR